MKIPDLAPGVRPARPDDVPAVAELVRALAVHERQSDEAQASDDQLTAELFGDDPSAHCLVAEQAGTVVGIAVWHRTFSTWTGTAGIHLVDLFLHEDARGSGLGRGLMVSLARIATANGWARLEWDVSDWNTPSIAFYDALGGRPVPHLIGYRLADDALHAVAALE